MKTMFIPVKLNHSVNKFNILELSKSLPKNIAIAYSIQYKDIADEIKQELSKKHKITCLIQVLGCSNPKFSKDTQGVLLVGSGRFHAISLAYETKLPIYIYTVEANKMSKVSQKDVDLLERTHKSAYVRYLNADRVGILISTKPGQENLKEAMQLKKNLKNKKSYLFISNNINNYEFENFGIKSWINTACPRIDMTDASVININRLK